MDSIEKLKKLTADLPGIPRLDDLLLDASSSKHSIIYKVDEGTSFGLALLNRPEVAVQELFVSKGTKWPSHLHDTETEWGIIYKGDMEVVVDGEKSMLGPGDCVRCNKKEVHSSEAITDCWLIAIAVPRIEGYPE